MTRTLLASLLFLSAAGAVQAQTPAMPPPGTTANVEVDPIRCWWRTAAGAVRIGEKFDLSLTCAVLENDAVQVVPDESHLGASVVAMAPFEVLGGPPPSTLRSGERRFFQYRYAAHHQSGRDRQGHQDPGHGAALQGEQPGRGKYVAAGARSGVSPADQSVRIASMVPADAGDIRDATGESFGTADSLRLRAGTFEIIAIGCVALGALMTIFVLVRLVRRAGQRTPSDKRMLSTRSLISAAIRDLSAVQREREQQGWTEALSGRALAATRIAAACAIGGPVTQPLAAGLDGDGRVMAPGPFRGKARALSSPVTPGDLVRAAASADPSRQPMLEELRDAMTTFTQTQYGRGGQADQTALDAALSSAVNAAGRVKAEHGWIKTVLQQLARNRAAVESRA
jgi:hypothetical protein